MSEETKLEYKPTAIENWGGLCAIWHTVKALLIRHIVHEQNTHGTSVVCGGDGSESLLASSVPYLQFDPLAIQVYGPNLEIYADRRDETGCEAIFAKP